MAVIMASNEKGGVGKSSVLMGLAAIADGEPVADGQKFTNLVSRLLEK